MPSLREAAAVVFQQCMGLKPRETALIIDDHEQGPIARALWEAARDAGAEATLLQMLPRERNGEEPPTVVADAMAAADVVVAPTSRSLTHTAARRRACDRGARIATMPGVTQEIMSRCIALDYEALATRSNQIAEALTHGSEVRIVTALGTDLTMQLGERQGMPDTGLLLQPGDYGNLPAGEAFIAPLEGTAEGTLVVDASLAGLGVLDEPVTLTIAGGSITDVAGGIPGATFAATLEAVGPAGSVLCELGVGTNDRARVTGLVLEDEKVLGTIHIAFGNNLFFGGVNDVQFHVDGVVTKPTLSVDGEVLIDAGVSRF